MFILLCLVIVLGCTSAEAASLTSEPPIVVTLGDNSVRAKFMWLDYGQIANGSVKTVELGVTNISGRALQVGAFSASNSLRARWIDSQLQPVGPSICNILPGERRNLSIEASFVDQDERPKVISLMSSGEELVGIVGKEIIKLHQRVALSVDQSSPPTPHPFWFSGRASGGAPGMLFLWGLLLRVISLIWRALGRSFPQPRTTIREVVAITHNASGYT